ncbi:hypothetical protein CEXT_591191 [Caerostris extrusa]|uniref:diacylglycerol cholinephosphotransferase n=1 Tax=Caerostris extrusa TaxID=172846 RepID=A0AAV4YBT9_CAEEX|nr:hypothetical protein CEXT_591191 [Caerostris extrusa]
MIFSSSDIMTPLQLRKLSEHKYNSQGYTLLDPMLQPFWNWLVNKLPYSLAPNLMTVNGLIITIVTTLILMYYSPDAQQEVTSSWAFLLCAAGLFVYQSLDACDGKQARRTGSSSPLGELFDHGCDSISTVFVSLGICIAVKLGAYPNWMFFQCFIAIILFYCAHWQTYITGSLRFGKFDVTECQCTIIIAHLISALFGTNVWLRKIPFLNVEIRLLPIILALCVSLVLCYFHIAALYKGGVGKNGSSVAGTSVLSPSIPIGIVIILSITIYQKSTENIYENHPCLYILAFGIVAAKVTNKLVVAHMTKSELDYFDSILIGPGMLFLNQYFNTFINEHIVLWLCLVYSIADLLHYCIIVCNQICNHLNIQLFKINPVPKVLPPRKLTGLNSHQPISPARLSSQKIS